MRAVVSGLFLAIAVTGCGNSKSTQNHALGEACASDSACSGGAAPLCCPSPDAGGALTCTDVTSDTYNCGSCGASCSSVGTGAGCCDGTCIDLNADVHNCGACGAYCDAGSDIVSCVNGLCLDLSNACPIGINACALPDGGPACACPGGCFDTSSDPQNCGDCGNTCASGVCRGFACQ